MPVVLNQYYNVLLGAKDPSSQKEQIFVIPPGQAVVTVAEGLEAQGLIKNAFAFRLLVAQMGITKTIQAGDFKMSPAQTSREIAEELTHGVVDVWVTLPEGLRIEEQVDIIEEKLKFGSNTNYQFNKKDYLKVAKEGYMFPDTYLIPKDASAKNVVDKLTSTFDEKTKELLKDNQTDLTNEQIIVLASLIERESRNNEEKAIIAGILNNRLNNGIALQVDATVQYAKGFDGKSWWPQITLDDYRLVKSPYNTYLSAGLPPKPIANPGIDSITAALNPKDSNYLYYLHDTDGNIHYAKTIDEHNRNVEEFIK